jgi:hypothetical protein
MGLSRPPRSHPAKPRRPWLGAGSRRVERARMRRVILSIVAASIVAIIGVGFTIVHWLIPQPENPKAWQDSALVRGVVFDGRVWVLSLSGRLWSVGLDSQKSVEESTPGRVVDICTSGRALFALIGEPGAARWTLETRDGDAWRQTASIVTGRDRLFGIACQPQKVLILATRRVITVAGSSTSSVYSSEATPAFGRVVLFPLRHYLYVGIDKGEWGGALWQIDRRTGETVALSSGTNDDCRGPFNPDCSDVTGIAQDPWMPGCVVVSIGLGHLAGHTGRIIRVCGRRLATLYSRSSGKWNSLPFFGMVATGHALTAIGLDGIYRFDRRGDATVAPVPSFSNDGPIEISLAFPNAVLAVAAVRRDAWPNAEQLIIARP